MKRNYLKPIKTSLVALALFAAAYVTYAEQSKADNVYRSLHECRFECGSIFGASQANIYSREYGNTLMTQFFFPSPRTEASCLNLARTQGCAYRNTSQFSGNDRVIASCPRLTVYSGNSLFSGTRTVICPPPSVPSPGLSVGEFSSSFTDR